MGLNEEDAVGRAFDSLALRLRGKRCLTSSVLPPFGTFYWADVEVGASELGIPGAKAEQFEEPGVQQAFLRKVATVLAKDARFEPRLVGFSSAPSHIRSREEFRQRYHRTVFIGSCSRAVCFGALEKVAERLQPRGTVEIEFKGSDLLAEEEDWKDRLAEISNYLWRTRGLNSTFTVHSPLARPVPRLWDFVYDFPRLRICWVAAELAALRNTSQFGRSSEESSAFKNLREMSSQGLWPHVVLPVTASNVAILPVLTLAVLDATRGGTVDLVPLPLLSHWAGPVHPMHSTQCGIREEDGDGPPLRVQDYTESLMAIYREPRIPLQRVAPLGWVAARVASPEPLVSSPLNAGAELAVLSDGELYAGESAVGLEWLRLGNATNDPEGLRWERIDAVAEMFSNDSKPRRGHRCDWRYRCGGVDASVPLLEEAAQKSPTECHPAAGAGSSASNPAAAPGLLSDLYCAPRSRLFEEMLWDSAAGASRRPQARERLNLHENGLDFVPIEVPPSQPASRTISTTQLPR